MPPPGRLRLVAVVGPTATGKSALAVDIALQFDGEVINADSRLFYRGLDIGTAKPSAAEERGVPHHLIDILGPYESFSLASFLDLARAVISDVTGRGRLPVLVGGAGQYVWGLLEGWDVPRVPPNAELRADLERGVQERGVESLYKRLVSLNPEAAASVDSRNPRRVARALEMALSEQPVVRPRKAAAPPYDALVIGLTMPRPSLYARVDRRIDRMVAAGWVDEVRSLLARGAYRDAPAMTGIGYREIASHLAGEMTLEEAVAAARKATRRLIRHQYNWFKLSDPRILWLDAGPGARGRAVEAVRTSCFRDKPARPAR